MPRVIAVCNQKGGVGKTSITLGLADVLAHQGRRILIIDADAQANATTSLGVTDPPFTLNDVLTSGGGEVTPGVITDAATPAGPGWDRIDVVASERALAAREQDQVVGRELRLRTALDGDLSRWDLVLIDCPPSLGQLSINALVAADAALLVTEPRATSVDGLSEIVRTLGTVRRALNPGLALAGVVVNRHRADRRDRTEWVDQLRTDYGNSLLEPAIPEREVVAVASSAAAPLTAYGSRAKPVLDALAPIAATLLTDPEHTP